jgi:DNA-binding response OmpR family regulator
MAGRKILIVDDDPVARQIAHTALKAAGYETVLAGDAMSALTQTRNQKPDLIILDIGLPAGGGFTFFERMKAFPALAVTPVLVVSGMDRATTEAKAREAGAAAYFEKPVAPDALVAKVRELLG